MDALSDVLKSVHLEGALYLHAEFTAPWCMRGKYGLATVRQRLAGAEHVVYFHLLTEGSCKVKLIDGGEVHEVSAGDLVLFPRDDRHLMGSDLHVAPLDAENWNGGNEPAPELVPYRNGGGGAVTRFVCGFLACNRTLCRPLLDALPRVLCIPIGDGTASGVLHELLRLGVAESSSAERPGAQSTLTKLAELVFVEALRRYAESLPPGGKGWLAAVRD
ncbi:MAG: cupin domain-containing protein, partial [Burkholderiales bacterium]